MAAQLGIMEGRFVLNPAHWIWDTPLPRNFFYGHFARRASCFELVSYFKFFSLLPVFSNWGEGGIAKVHP